MTSNTKSRRVPTKSVSQRFKFKEMDTSLLKENDDEFEFETNLENFDVEKMKK